MPRFIPYERLAACSAFCRPDIAGPTSHAAANSSAVLARITAIYSSSVVAVFLAAASCMTSPSAITAAAAERISNALRLPTSTIILNAWPRRKSPTRTLASLPHSMRGRLAARMLWGNEASVLVGDFLLGQAFKMMVEVGSLKALEILSAAAAVIAEGEVMQLAAAKNTATTEDEYIAVIRAKTAELFAAACEVGPAISGRQKAEQAASHSYGMNLGITFQLVDDALDYGGVSSRLGKNIGDDFREGKITLPVVLAFRRGSDAEREFWRRTLEHGEATDADLDHAIGLMVKHRAIEDTIGRAHHYGAIARDALALFPDSKMKAALAETVEFCIARSH